jgi:hypothetical protein
MGLRLYLLPFAFILPPPPSMLIINPAQFALLAELSDYYDL